MGIDTKLRVVVGQGLANHLPSRWTMLSAESLGQWLSPAVVAGMEAAASYAYHVHSSIAESLWEGAKTINRR